MSKFGARDFCGTRCRFQRLSDAKLFNGWIEAFEDESILLSTSTGAAVNIGDEFRVEAYGKRIAVSFNARLTSVEQLDLGGEGIVTSIEGKNTVTVEATAVAFNMVATSPVRYSASNESVRLRTPDIPSSVEYNGVLLNGITVDISEHGCGILLKRELKQGILANLTIQASSHKVEVTGELKFCKPDRDRGGWFRCGFYVEEMDRLQRPKWQRLLKELC